MNEKTNINDFTYDELLELEKRMKLKVEKYNQRLEGIAKQKKLQFKKEKAEKKLQAKNEKAKIQQAKLIDKTFDKELKDTQVIKLDVTKKPHSEQEMFKVSVDRSSRNSLSDSEVKEKKNQLNDVNTIEKAFKKPVKKKKESPQVSDADKPKKKRQLIPILLILFIFIIGGSAYAYTKYKDTYLLIPEFTTSDILDVENWALANNIEIVRNYEHSDTIEENIIIYQSIKQGIKVNRYENKLEVLVSLGPDYTRELNIDESTFAGMTMDEILEWAMENFVKNYEFEFILDDNIELEKYISFNTEDLNSDTSLADYNRSQKFIFQISLGNSSEEFADSTIIDFSEMTKSEIELWLIKRGLKVSFDYDFSDDIEKDALLRQDVQAGTTVKSGTTIKITLSLGSGVKVPNFTKMTLNDISSFAKENKITVKQSLKFSNTISKNKVISQTISEGERVKENSTISIVVSFGKVDVVNFYDEEMRVEDIDQWLNSVNKYGANLSVSYIEEWDNSTKGSLVSQNIEGFVNTGTKITITISKGPSIIIPKFTSKQDVEAFEANNNVNINYSVTYHNLDADKVISQSKEGEFQAGSTIDVRISKGKIKVPDFINKSKADVESFKSSVNQYGGNITFTFSYTYSSKGINVVDSSNTNGYMSPGSTLNIILSKGEGITLINFDGKSITEVNNWCNPKGITCKVIYESVYNESVTKDYAIGNAALNGTKVDIGDEVNVIFSKGPEPTAVVPAFDQQRAKYEGTSFDSTKSKVAAELNIRGFINYQIIAVDNGQTTGTLVPSWPGYSIPKSYKISDEIKFYVQQ